MPGAEALRRELAALNFHVLKFPQHENALVGFGEGTYNDGIGDLPHWFNFEHQSSAIKRFAYSLKQKFLRISSCEQARILIIVLMNLWFIL